MKQRVKEAGFTAIELLITLFIAAAFIGTAYQLYSIVIDDSGTARARASASNIGYATLRKYSPQATNPCSTVTASPTPTIPANSGLSAASISVTFSCPYGTSSSTTKVLVSVKYGAPQQEVVHALYVAN